MQFNWFHSFEVYIICWIEHMLILIYRLSFKAMLGPHVIKLEYEVYFRAQEIIIRRVWVGNFHEAYWWVFQYAIGRHVVESLEILRPRDWIYHLDIRLDFKICWTFAWCQRYWKSQNIHSVASTRRKILWWINACPAVYWNTSFVIYPRQNTFPSKTIWRPNQKPSVVIE